MRWQSNRLHQARFYSATFIDTFRRSARSPGGYDGIFLPGFVLVALTGPSIKKIRTSATAARFLDAVNAAAVALMLVVLCQLSRDAIIDLPSLVIAVVSDTVEYDLNQSNAFNVGRGGCCSIIHPR